MENLKRKLQAMTSERDNAKQEVAKLVESADASTSSGYSCSFFVYWFLLTSEAEVSPLPF